jgi:hypothetical protein
VAGSLPLVGLILALATTAHASPAFGPKEYVVQPGLPLPVIERFPACQPEQGGQLRVENGPGGRPRAALAVVVLNRRETVLMLEGSGQPQVRERPVQLVADNTLLVWMIGPQGATLAVSVTSAGACLDVAITSPAPGASVPEGILHVRGTVAGAPEIGVVVNGQRASVHVDDADIGYFIAQVAVDPAVTEVAAIATARDGQTAEIRVPITVTGAPEPTVTLRPSRGGGAAPLDVSFSVSSLSPVARIYLDLHGDGTSDFEGESLEEQLFTYQQPGVYQPQVVVIDPAGGTASATAVVHVYDAAALDRLLRDQWAAFGNAVAGGDVAAAVQTIVGARRDVYRAQLDDLAAGGLLSLLATELASINLLRFLGGAVEYDLRAVRDGVEYSFHVVFVQDVDGVWRLWAF